MFVCVQKWEREKLEKQKQQADKAKAKAEKDKEVTVLFKLACFLSSYRVFVFSIYC